MITIVTPQEVNDMMHSEEDFILVDVLTKEMWRKQHLPKAISVEVPKVVNVLSQIADKNHKIVLYCYDTACEASSNAAKELEKSGFTDVYDMEVGIEGYKEAGFPVVTNS